MIYYLYVVRPISYTNDDNKPIKGIPVDQQPATPGTLHSLVLITIR